MGVFFKGAKEHVHQLRTGQALALKVWRDLFLALDELVFIERDDNPEFDAVLEINID